MPDGDEVTFKSPTTGKVQAVSSENWDAALQQGYRPVSHVVMYDKSGQRGMVPKEQAGQYRDQGYTITAPGSETAFEKARPGKGITLEGAGSAFGRTLKGMLPPDPTGGHPLLSREAWLDVGFDPSRSGLAEAGREARAGWQRGGLSEAVPSGLGGVLGISGRHQAELAAQGRGGEIIGESAAMATPAVASLALPAIGEARQGLQRMAYRELPSGEFRLKPGAMRLARAGGTTLGAGIGHATGIPGAGYAGGVAGYELGPSVMEGVLGKPKPTLTYPGAQLPSASEFYEQRGASLMKRREPISAQPSTSPFAGATSSANPPRTPLPQVGSVLGNQPKVELVPKFAPPEPPRIVSSESAPSPFKVTYQSVPQRELYGKIMQGDTEAVREWQRRGLELPTNVRYLTEPGAPTVPWRNLEK